MIKTPLLRGFFYVKFKKFYLYIVRNGSIDRISERNILMISKSSQQITSNILMIRPCRFFSNPKTAISNKFQGKSLIDGDELQRVALDEFDQLVDCLLYTSPSPRDS